MITQFDYIWPPHDLKFKLFKIDFPIIASIFDHYVIVL